ERIVRLVKANGDEERRVALLLNQADGLGGDLPVRLVFVRPISSQPSRPEQRSSRQVSSLTLKPLWRALIKPDVRPGHRIRPGVPWVFHRSAAMEDLAEASGEVSVPLQQIGRASCRER